MRLRHFEAFAPVCPVCARTGPDAAPLVIAHVGARTDETIEAGTLHCPSCQHEYPIIDGMPVIVPDLAKLMGERGVELMLRDDIDPVLESLLGDAIGPDSWLDAMRQVQSTYGWDGYGDLDPAPDDGDLPPGAARRCLARLLELAGPGVPGGPVLDLGCAAGRTSFALAKACPDALVLGADMHLGLLRLARRAAGGEVSYPRRRIGLVYDRRRYAVALEGSERVDFWACGRPPPSPSRHRVPGSPWASTCWIACRTRGRCCRSSPASSGLAGGSCFPPHMIGPPAPPLSGPGSAAIRSARHMPGPARRSCTRWSLATRRMRWKGSASPQSNRPFPGTPGCMRAASCSIGLICWCWRDRITKAIDRCALKTCLNVAPQFVLM